MNKFIPPNPPFFEHLWPTNTNPHYPVSTTGHRSFTSKWIYPEEEIRFYDNQKKGLPNLYSDTDIEYKFNKWGFRCTEFDEITEGSIRVLSLGCSNTEGVGLPVNHTWPHLLCNLIQENEGRPVTDLNLGAGGSANRTIAIYGVSAIETLKPDVIFVSWTYAMRILYVYPDMTYENWLSIPLDEVNSKHHKTQMKINYFSDTQNDFNDINNLLVDMKLLNYAARCNNIPICNNLLFLNHDEQKYARYRFPKESLVFPQPKSPWGEARDLMHPGLRYNTDISTELFEWYKNYFRK